MSSPFPHWPRMRNGALSVRSRMARVSGCPISAYRPCEAGLLPGPSVRRGAGALTSAASTDFSSCKVLRQSLTQSVTLDQWRHISTTG